MVIIDGEKYACERCIRGHRVSSCNHEDAPLTHIKPKGRPASQCQHCREARKAGGGHNKCGCGSNKSSCQCQITSKCDCNSKAKARLVPVPPPQQTITVQPTPTEPGTEIELGTIDENARSSPFQTWYPPTADAYNAVPSVVPTFGFEDDTAPLSHAREFVDKKSPATTEVWYAKMTSNTPPQIRHQIDLHSLHNEYHMSDRVRKPENPNSWY